MKKILVTGSSGQIGSELILTLRNKYGHDNVLASDLYENDKIEKKIMPYEKLDVLNKLEIERIVKKYNIDTIYHLAAILSAAGEKNPQLCFEVNIIGLYNIIEVARESGVKQIICPSSIAVFGPETPRELTSQKTIIMPKTMYGISKAAGELICDYYTNRYNMDIRGLRYPGLISHKTLPGGGTTDYAVEIFYEAIKNKKYTCFLEPKTRLPMMYMEDAIRGTIELAEAEFSKLKNYSNFNFAAISFSCEELADEIKKHIPDFVIEYKPDFRQKIANSWPMSIDDRESREQWGWRHNFNIEEITLDMIKNLKKKINY